MKVPFRIAMALAWVAIGLGCLPARAQEASTAVPSAIESLAGDVGDARAKLEASELDETFKVPIREQLDEADKRLEEAKDSRRRAAAFEEATPLAPQKIETLKKELAGLADRKSIKVEIPEGTGELRAAVEEARAGVTKLESERQAKDREVTALQERPLQVSTRLPAANAELSQAEAQLAAFGEVEDASIGETVDRLLLRAELAALRAEVDRLEAERVGQSGREEQVNLELQILEKRLDQARERLRRLESALGKRLAGEVDAMKRQVSELAERVPSDRGSLAEVAAGLPELVARLEEQAAQSARVSSKSGVMRNRLDRLRRDNEKVRRQIELTGLEGAFTQVLLDQLQRLPERRGLDYDLKQLERELSEAQLDALQIEEWQEQQKKWEQRWKNDPVAAPVLETRRTLLDRLGAGQRGIIRDLARLGADEQAYRDLVAEMSKFLSDQLFWRRSSEPIGPRFFEGIGRSRGVLFSSKPWGELKSSILAMHARHPMAILLVASVIVVLVALRRRLRRSIEKSGQRIRRISTDRIVHTLRALLDSLLLALPVPLALGFLSWSLASEPGADPWVRGFGLWLRWAAVTLMWILSLCELARDGGVGRVHLGWDAGVAEMITRWLPRLAAIYLPTLFVATITLFDGESHAFDSIGRLGFILSQAGLAWVMLEMFRPDRGMFAKLVEEQPERPMVRGRFLWAGLLVGIPLALIVMAVAGFTLTAFILSEQFLSALRWAALGIVIYGVSLRWFMIKQRRLALAEAIEQRKARREAAEKTGDEGEETVTVDDDQIELGLDAVARQTRRLLRSLVSIGVVVAIAYGVAKTLPIDQAASELSIDGRLDWFGVLKAILIAAVTFTGVKNLPGLLDLVGLRASGMTPGTRYAVATLCQYVLGAIGIFLVTSALALDWSRFGWIAAALSVGLGFGLQEIVANFVCGIILLFERPIRVGDVVTVGEVTGTVSRIRMRATTITNWERQEFVVPNKDFVTGSLINWTLSSPLNRITIPVGVAYGSDTVRARQILGEIAADHPVVLEDPAPLISFEAFADSTLNLSLRCYLPDMDNRLKTITEIHEEIDRRFKEAGIEIAFPQRDLHIRTVPNEMIRGAKAESPET